MKWAKPFSLPFLFHFLLETVKVAFFLESFSSEGEREKKSGNGGNRLVVADLLLEERRSGMKFQFGTVAIAPRDSANSVTIFLDYQPVRPRHKVAGTRCSTGETTHVRYGLIGRAREFSVTSWRFFFFSIRLFTLPSRYFTFQTRVTRVLYIIGPVDIFLKYFSSFVVHDIVYIFNHYTITN